MHSRQAWPQALVRHSILNQSELRGVRLCDGYVIEPSGAEMLKLVDKIGLGRQMPSANFAAKRTDPAADVNAWEREIDERVYRLYGLTAEEIKIVEGERKV
jgi:hypothetical protein